MTQTYEIKCGRRLLNWTPEEEIVIPESDQIRITANSPEDALSNPIGSPLLSDLARGSVRTTIVVPDGTRAWQNVPLMATAVREELARGGVDSVNWVIGGGQHRLPSNEEIDAILGEAPQAKDNIHLHDCTSFVSLDKKTSRRTEVTIHQDVAEADFVVLIGGIVHHDLAGFSGGRKAIIPGASGKESIRANHALSLLDGGFHPQVACGNLKGNPVSEDMIEYCHLILKGKKTFLLNVIPDGEGKPCRYVAGDIDRAWRAGIENAKELQALQIPRRMERIVVSSGGHPYDLDLYQATKAISAVLDALAPTGGLVLAADLEDGVGPGTFEDSLRLALEEPQRALEELKKDFSIPAFIAVKVVFDLMGHPAALVTSRRDVPFPGPVFEDINEASHWLNSQCGCDGPTLYVPAGNCVVVRASEDNRS